MFKKLQSFRTKEATEISVGYKPKPTLNKSTFLLVFAVLLTGASFYEGTVFQHSADANGTSVTVGTSTVPGNGGNGTQAGSFAKDHIIGQVAAISSGSITVQDQRTGQDTTLGINSNTTIESENQSITTGTVQTGDLVIVTKTSTSSTTATRIIVAPGSWGSSNSSGNNTQQSATNDPMPGLSSN